MASFDSAYIKIISGHEGGYVNDPTDRGGETYKGIARKRNPAWHGWSIIDRYNKNVSLMNADPELQNEVLFFYKREYWDKVAGDHITDQDVANELFDIAVNMGHNTAGKFVQHALNLLNKNAKLWNDIAEDGIIGLGTLGILNNAPPVAVLKCLNGQQFERYMELCESDPSQEKFLNGWLTRI